MTLAPRERTLARLSAAIALGRLDLVRSLRRSAPPGEPDAAWREAVLQSHLFAGFPRVVAACEALEEEGGLGTPGPDERGYETDRLVDGRALFTTVYGDSAPTVRAKLARAHPLLARWIEGHAYGRVLARPGLALRERELLACAALAALGQERQLASHARGALRAGATTAELAELVDGLEDVLGAELAQRGHRALTALAQTERG
jgi:4-carboxymuconolactone decarboxylase